MTNWLRPIAALATGMSLLTACGGATSDPTVCPPVVSYSPAFQARAAGELERLTPGSALEEMLKDYAGLRDQLRACRASAKLAISATWSGTEATPSRFG